MVILRVHIQVETIFCKLGNLLIDLGGRRDEVPDPSKPLDSNSMKTIFLTLKINFADVFMSYQTCKC